MVSQPDRLRLRRRLHAAIRRFKRPPHAPPWDTVGARTLFIGSGLPAQTTDTELSELVTLMLRKRGVDVVANTLQSRRSR
jgi:hypothetical protein